MEYVTDFDLSPRYANVKSFYGKAHIREFNDRGVDTFKLYSYGTLVCIIKKDTETGSDKIYRLDDDELYTATTLRHCKEFLKQLANSRILFIPEVHKKDILDLPVWEE